MEGTGKHAVTVMVMMMALLLWGCLMMMTGAEAHIEKGGCLEGCLEGCKHSGISPLRCFKYCEKHCGSLSASFAAGGHKQQQPAPAPPPAGHHYCNLGCMFEKCSKFHDDEAKEEACAFDCKNHVCKPANS
ncbi:protein TAP1-like [Coffea arabica]|uniref:Protein TAP1-like n=1 Tax=Coffea arabica TaxID=13443 RepID=A0ABM4W207_COFAR